MPAPLAMQPISFLDSHFSPTLPSVPTLFQFGLISQHSDLHSPLWPMNSRLESISGFNPQHSLGCSLPGSCPPHLVWPSAVHFYFPGLECWFSFVCKMKMVKIKEWWLEKGQRSSHPTHLNLICKYSPLAGKTRKCSIWRMLPSAPDCNIIHLSYKVWIL